VYSGDELNVWWAIIKRIKEMKNITQTPIFLII